MDSLRPEGLPDTYIPLFEHIWLLSERRVSYLKEGNYSDWYKGGITHFEGIYNELEETREQLIEDNHVYLEDELGDILWDYCCTLHGLHEEGKIDKSRIFSRIYKKFSERVGEDGRGGKQWESVKKKQKEELRREQDKVKTKQNVGRVGKG